MLELDDEPVGVTTRRMATARAQTPVVPPPGFDAPLERAAATMRRGKPSRGRRATIGSASDDEKPNQTSIHVAQPGFRRDETNVDVLDGCVRAARRSARLAAKPVTSLAPTKRTVSRTAASETRGAGSSKKTRVSNQVVEAPRHEPISHVTTNEVERRDEASGRGPVNGGGSTRTRRDPQAQRAPSRRIQERQDTSNQAGQTARRGALSTLT